MRPPLWQTYAVLGVAGALGAALAFPSARGALVVLTTLTTAALLVGIARGNVERGPWLWLGGGLLVLGAGAVARVGAAGAGAAERSAIADLVHVAGFVLLSVGVGRLVRSRIPRSDWPSLVDTAILTTGAAVVFWTFLIEPHVRVAGQAPFERLAHTAYPVALIALIAAVTRLFVGFGRRPAAYDLLAVGLLLTIASGAAYSALSLDGHTEFAGPVDFVLGLGIVCFGVVALHDGLSWTAEEQVGGERERRVARLAVLAAAILSVPGALALEQAVGFGSGWVVPTLGSVVLYVLVLVRMARLLAEQGDAAQREAILRDAATALSAVRGERIPEIALDAARRLAAGVAGGTVRMIPSGEKDVASLLRHGITEICPVPPWAQRRLRLPDDVERMLVLPFLAPGGPRGGVAAAATAPFPRELRDALESLGRQAGLALEASALNERLFKQRSEARFRSLVQNSTDVITVTGADMTIRFQTPSVVTVLGYEQDELTDTKLIELVHEDDRDEFRTAFRKLVDTPGASAAIELRIVRRDGRARRAEIVATNLLEDPTVDGIVLTLRDVTERRQLEERLAHQAFHDALTGLANRALFVDRVEHALSRRSRIAVLFVDVDDFKNVNDSLGHEEGDHLLREVATRVEGCLRPADTVARLGGDEFAILLEDVTEVTEAIRVAERITMSFEEPFALAGRDVLAGVSIGVAVSSLGTTGANDLLRDADVAMYRAKSAGKGHYEVFEQGMHEEALRRFEVGAELRRAIDVPELVLHYQPIVDLRSYRIVATEALVRWEHPERGLLPPGEFIPLAEETGLVRAIDGFALFEACRQARVLQAAYAPHRIQVTVNVSARSLQDPVLLLDVEEALRQAGLDPTLLVLELTESALMQSLETSVARLQALRAMGVQVAVDDFGTGYSSLSYLRNFPVDILKVAKPFVDGMARSGDDLKLAAVIVDLSAKFDLRTIAEGVESVAQRELLRELGCDMAQGYHFGKPLTSDRMADLLRMSAAGDDRSDEADQAIAAARP